MGQVTNALQWAGRKLRRLRSLVKDEDHDTWYDDHGGDRQKPPNLMGPGSQGGG